MEPEVESFLRELGDELVRRDFQAAGRRLAPWLGKDGPALLRREILAREAETREMWHDREIGPAELAWLDENPLSAEELREDEVPLPEEVTEENFLLWACVSVQADEGEWSLYDLWCAVVRSGAGLAVGYFEVLDPD